MCGVCPKLLSLRQELGTSESDSAGTVDRHYCWPEALAFGFVIFSARNLFLACTTVCENYELNSTVDKTKTKMMGCRKGSKNNSKHHEAGGK
jgi:hypothetical protein